MANLLLNASSWQDEAGTAPPSYWNGTAYEFIAVYVGHAATITATASAGDTVALTLQVNGAASRGTALSITVNGAEVFANDLTTIGSFTFTSAALSAGDVAAIKFATLYGYDAYDLDATLTPIATAIAACDELGRTTKCYVSGYNRGRVHQSRLMTGEKRCLVADFNGALPLGRTIAGARWRCDIGCVVAMSNARIPTGSRSTEIDVSAQWIGAAMLLCEATLDNGEVYTQMFAVDVSGNPYFVPSSITAGPLELTATA